MLAWIVANKEWLFGGIGVAVPLAIVGWWLQQRSSSASQSHPERKTGHAAAVIHGEKTAGKDEKKKERANNTIGGMPKQEWAFWTTRAPERIAFSYRMETVRWAIVVLLLLSGGTFALATFGLVPEGAKSFLTAGVKFSIIRNLACRINRISSLLRQVACGRSRSGALYFLHGLCPKR